MRQLGVLIPILALAIPVCAIIFGSLVKIQQAKVQEARLRLEAGGSAEIVGQLDDLREEMQQVRAELAEVHERLDFTERLLASGRSEGPAR